MTFLGMKGFSSDWIEDYALITSPLREMMMDAGMTTLNAPFMHAAAAFEKHQTGDAGGQYIGNGRLHTMISTVCGKQK